MSYSLEEKIKSFAVFSRLGIIIFQFFTNLLISDHDAGAFQKPLNVNNEKSYLDVIVNSVLGGFTNWDAQYFLHIAEYGYTYENTLAFFPLFPFIIRQLSYFILFIVNFLLDACFGIKGVISFHSILILVSVIFNNCIFVKNSVILFKLSLSVLKNEKLAYISAILFCMNPASIFFSACYSESLYCFLTFYGMLKVEESYHLLNYVILGMTGAVRSNGIINLGFLIYKYLIVKCMLKILPPFHNLIFIFGIILSTMPFLAFQMYSFAKFCLPRQINLPYFIYTYGKTNNFVFPGNNSSWCTQSVPFSYSYVQKHYWNVGFLNYYEVKQIPNFFLAGPIIYIMFQGTWSYVKNWIFKTSWSWFLNMKSRPKWFLSMFPYVVHAIFLTIFAIFTIHIQVATRLLASSSPAPYWFCAQVMEPFVEDTIEIEVLRKLSKADGCFYENLGNKKSKWKTFIFSATFQGYAFFIKWYFISYFFVGTLMFSNYLPWT